MSGFYKVTSVPHPATEEEVFLKTQIAEIEREYEKRIRPLVDRLVKIHQIRLPNYVIMPCDSSELGAFQMKDVPLARAEDQK